MQSIASLILALTLGTAPNMTTDEVRAWERQWHAKVEELGALSIELMAEYRQIQAALQPQIEVSEPQIQASLQPQVEVSEPEYYRGMGDGRFDVERWRTLVETFFGTNTDAALRVMRCESGGNEFAKNPSGASGLFQFMPSTWEWVMDEEYPGSVWDGMRNIEAAAILSKGGTDWSHWSCRP